jgi:hypothetical protein
MHNVMWRFTRAVGWAVLLLSAGGARADVFTPGNLVVTRSVYSGDASTVTIGQTLPPGNTSSTITAIANGTYPGVFANNTVDGSFGVTSQIFIDQVTPSGQRVSSFALPTSFAVTSFSSKSELAVNFTPGLGAITFMGYAAAVNKLDVSNSNTPGVFDPTNPVVTSSSRLVVQVDRFGNVQVTPTNAYSGNNGRAVVLGANGLYYTVGNSNNGTGTPANVVAAAGAQIVTPGQGVGAPTNQVGSFSITQINPLTGQPYASKPDKAGKDNNFRGETIFNNTLYITKGSGSNGINTVYQVGTAGTLPSPGATIDILPGFPTTLAKDAGAMHPFGIWFADANTLYVADEGDGTAADVGVDGGGLQKWSRDPVTGIWHLDYILTKGLQLGVPYGVLGLDPSLDPATDGLRNLTGILNGDGTVTLYAITSTISASGDQGADPNRLVAITDRLAFTTAGQAAGEQFTTLQTAGFGEVLRGVAVDPAVPEPTSLALFVVGGIGLAAWRWRRRKPA